MRRIRKNYMFEPVIVECINEISEDLQISKSNTVNILLLSMFHDDDLELNKAKTTIKRYIKQQMDLDDLTKLRG